MSKNTGTSELINYFDLGANGDVGIAGSLDINTIANATTDTDTFLVSDTGIIKYRTGTQLLSDIGAQGALTNPVTGTGAAGQVAYWSSGSAITGISNFLFDASQRNLTIDRSLSTLGNAITISKGSDADQAWLAFKQGGGASGTWRLGYTGDPYDFRINVGSDSSIGTQALRIFLASQNVVIGTATGDNGAKLQVIGSDNSNIFTLLSGLNSRLHIGTVNSTSLDVYIRSQNNYNLKLGTNNSDYLTILNDGNVGIGTTTPTSSFNARLAVRNEDAANNPTLVLFKNINSGSAEDIFRVQSWNGAFNTVASIRANGSANFLSSVSATSLRSSTVGTFGFNTASNGEFQIYSTAESGLVMAGRGSSFDMVITNKNGADTIRIPTGTTNVNFVGNVGIGTTNPDNKLAVWGTNNSLTSSQGNINVYTTDSAAIDTGGSIGLGGYYSGTSLAIPFANITGKKENSSSGNAAGYLAFLTRNNGTGTGERMRITSGGNVGIGTTNPDGQLSGTIGLSIVHATNAAVGLSNGTNHWLNYLSGTTYRIWNNSVAEVMTLTYGGNVLIGTTTNPGFRLYVSGSGNVVGITSSDNALSLGLGTSGLMSGYLGATASALYAYSTNGGYVLLNASSVWVPASDAKRKRNFEPYTNGLSSILGLQPKLYNMDFQKDGDEKQVGLVAQEVREFIPLAYEENNGFIGLNYNAIIVTIVKAIQEQQEQIDKLKNL